MLYLVPSLDLVVVLTGGIALVVYILGWILLERHAFGRHILAIGDGELLGPKHAQRKRATVLVDAPGSGRAERSGRHTGAGRTAFATRLA